MSASLARRPRDRAGGSAGPKAPANHIKPSKPLTPTPIFVKRSSTAGKENPPGPTSKTNNAASLKPAIRPMLRVDKAAVSAGHVGEPRVRWSTSSAPRGRSPSPSEFTRVLSDMRKDRRVSTDRNVQGSLRESDRMVASAGKTLNGFRVSESVKQKKGGFGDLGFKPSDLGVGQIKIFKDCKEDGGRVGLNLEKKNGVCEELKVNVVQSEKIANKVREFNNGGDTDGVDSSSDLVNPNGFDKKVPILVRVDNKAVRIGNGIHLGQKNEVNEECTKDVMVLEVPKEKGLGEEGFSGRGGNKYPSKLHEKLAFLEGKVKRIASDIKRTKEMLDMNNPDTSKVILSDIQEKISGIENAMGNVTVDPNSKKGILKGVGQDEQDVKMVEKGRIEEVDNSRSLVKGIEQVDNGKSSVKVLKSEDLEARLFPHHKLLRGRTTLKASSVSSQSVESQVGEPNCESMAEDKSLSPIDEHRIAVEFLASLDKEHAKVTTRDARAGSEYCDVEEMDCDTDAGGQESSNIMIEKNDVELILTTDEILDEFDDQENRQGMILGNETEDTSSAQLNEIGCKATTAGWFVNEGESVLLSHDDGTCTFYDIVNCEGKAVFRPPAGVCPNMWRDCWIVRAPSADGCSGRYVVAASAGNATDSGFCSWDFYSKDVQAFYTEDGKTPARSVLSPLPNNILYRRGALCNNLEAEIRQWWYKPCGPLIISTASCQRVMRIHDIRDGEQVMKWDVQKPVLCMDYSSPLQWRNRGKVVVAEAEAISLWDVNSLNPQALLSVSTSGRKVSALHVNNTDAELGGGVRQRSTSSEAEGNDGVFCTQDSINILDFRHPSGVGLKISKLGVNVQSVFSRGDSIYLGCNNVSSGAKKQFSSEVQQFSMRNQRLFSTYAFPECNADSHQRAITQVWGNSNTVMGVCGRGLFVFDPLKDNELQCFTTEFGKTQNVREIIGPDDLYSPCFDYLSSRALLISRDRPAMWRHLT
ncbi:KIN14B-interacting protein At4g14310 [Ziziphus jujuba]|uniref:KIN14B-interacting protein At4g14310 n=1 Tax=Ziziphus jujuba TaxID=326968 RepID=A0A6P4A2T5_ZIZJJ|nr:KIN14B-interacting protein At4g14310 [Ziziphus jujuba]